MDLSFKCLVDLVATIQAAGLRASLDPGDLSVPGVWVTCDGVLAANLARDYQVSAVLYLVTDDRDYRRSLESLADMFNVLVPTVLVPDGPVVPQGVLMPDTSTPLPALRVPVILNESE